VATPSRSKKEEGRKIPHPPKSTPRSFLPVSVSMDAPMKSLSPEGQEKNKKVLTPARPAKAIFSKREGWLNVGREEEGSPK